MYILKNAWLSITRNKGRNILIGIIITTIAIATTVTLAIRNSSEELISSYESEYEVLATIGTDRSKLMQNFDPKENSSDIDNKMNMFGGSANTIITNTYVVDTVSSANENLTVNISPTFVLTSKDVIEKFESELHNKGLSEYLTINTNLDQVNSATESISNVKTFVTTFLIITLCIGAVVLFVINMINLRERKYEIGVLRTIGMKKSSLTSQFITELCIISLISLIIGAGIGSCISVPISNKLLENEINTSEENISEINNNFGGKDDNKMTEKINGVRVVSAFDSIDATVDYKVLIELLGLGLLLTLISSSASMISIQRFSPLTILKERS